METYLQAFINYKQDNGVRLLPMAKFAYNNVKNASIGHTPFELNCSFYPQTSYEKDINPCSELKLANKLVIELRNLMTICRKKFQHVQELQKRYYDNHTKPKNYVPSDKVSFNSKYIKTK